MSLEIFEMRNYIYERDNYQCQYPGCNIKGYDNLQMAHRIAKTKSNVLWTVQFIFIEYGSSITKKEAMKILNNKLNLVASCPEHNSRFNIGFDPEKTGKLIKEIWENEL